jgi:hypothetical protein
MMRKMAERKILSKKKQWVHLVACAFTFMLFSTMQNASFQQPDLRLISDFFELEILPKYFDSSSGERTVPSASGTPYIYYGINSDSKRNAFYATVNMKTHSEPSHTNNYQGTNERLFFIEVTSTNKSITT